jgi:hypothetical protein
LYYKNSKRLDKNGQKSGQKVGLKVARGVFVLHLLDGFCTTKLRLPTFFGLLLTFVLGFGHEKTAWLWAFLDLCPLSHFFS